MIGRIADVVAIVVDKPKIELEEERRGIGRVDEEEGRKREKEGKLAGK